MVLLPGIPIGGWLSEQLQIQGMHPGEDSYLAQLEIAFVLLERHWLIIGDSWWEADRADRLSAERFFGSQVKPPLQNHLPIATAALAAGRRSPPLSDPSVSNLPSVPYALQSSPGRAR